MSDTRHADDTAILSAFAQQRRQGLTGVRRCIRPCCS